MSMLGWFLFGVFFMLGALAVNCVAALLLVVVEDLIDRRSDKRFKERSEKRFSEFMEDLGDEGHVHKYDMYVGDGRYRLEKAEDDG